MAGRVVLIEGLDLAGKSTLVENLRRELTRRGIPVRVSRNALCRDNPIAALADQVRRDPHAGLVETGALFLAAHLWDARHFTAPPDSTVHLQDSCWLRTLAYHTFRETPAIPEQLARAARYFPRFDLAVLLTAGVAERKRRLVQRQHEQPGANDEGDHAVVRDPRRFLAIECELIRLASAIARARVLDTTDLAPQELLRAMLSILG
jgi:thymidylate kinase